MSNETPDRPSAGSPAVQVRAFGPPLEAAELIEAPVPPLRPGEVRVRMECAPVNPADLNVLEGKYGTLPELPAVAGIEGVGRVTSAGCAATGTLVGKRVLLPHGFGSWRQFGNAKADELIQVPETVPVQQAAMLRINPATALCLLHHFTNLQPGEWIVQNAANSGVGRAVIQIARACGWKTVNIVRRPGLRQELSSIGADVVLEEGEGLARRVAGAVGGEKIRLALNAVGGECALEQAKALNDGGIHVTYGAMSRQPLRMPNGLLIFKDLAFRGFWVSRWYRTASAEEISTLFAKLFEWASAGVLHTPVEAVYRLPDARAAIAHAMRSSRSGKILLES